MEAEQIPASLVLRRIPICIFRHSSYEECFYFILLHYTNERILTMKKLSKSLLTVLLTLAVVLSLTACGKKNETQKQTDVNTTEQTQTSETNENVKAGLWENAVYLSDTEFGGGSKKLSVEVKAGDQSVVFTIHTDEATVGAALIENNLIAGDVGDYGLYVKTVNGITADYDVNQSYWAFYIDDEYASSGVDTTDISEESSYRLEYSK